MNRDEVATLMNEAAGQAWGTEEHFQRFAALIEARAAEREREAIMDEWWMCVQSDLENGVKSLNERAAEKWRKEYPEMARFGDVVRGRKENT